MSKLYMSLNKDQLGRLEDASNITEIDYEIKDSQIEVEALYDVIFDLVHEYHRLEEKFEDYRLHEDYAKFNPYKEYGVSEHDFH